MKIAVTGGGGFVGRFIVENALAAGHEVTVLSRHPAPDGFFSAPVEHRPFDLSHGKDVHLEGADALVHAAFSHIPGRYRGGEGSNPEGFLRRNLDGTVALFDAAMGAGVCRIVFLSSRAVYGDYPPGTCLTEDMTPRPDTLYGRAKYEAESALEKISPRLEVAANFRATGVYGPAGAGRAHKWSGLFDAFRRGEVIQPRIATEVHGDDLAAAVSLLLARGGKGPFNVSDIRLDRHDLLSEVAAATGWGGMIPPRCGTALNEMSTYRLRSLGWTPGGIPKLRRSLLAMLLAGGNVGG